MALDSSLLRGYYRRWPLARLIAQEAVICDTLNNPNLPAARREVEESKLGKLRDVIAEKRAELGESEEPSK